MKGATNPPHCCEGQWDKTRGTALWIINAMQMGRTIREARLCDGLRGISALVKGESWADLFNPQPCSRMCVLGVWRERIPKKGTSPLLCPPVLGVPGVCL